MKLLLGDAIEQMRLLPDQSIDLVLTDPPYGTTACKWDSIIPFAEMWAELHRLSKPYSAICLFGSEPFSTHLRMSNIVEYKYDWLWEKTNAPNFFAAKFQPLNHYENISVFSKGRVNQGKCVPMQYFPQGLIQISAIRKNSSSVGGEATHTGKGESNSFAPGKSYKQEFTNYPRKNLIFAQEKGFHPTQKPVSLLEYLIKTHSTSGQTVLDFTMGSGSTGVACKNTGRQFIGIEKDENYFNIATKRIQGVLDEAK